MALSCAGRGVKNCVRADLSACLSYQGKPTRNRNRFGECERQPQQLIHWTHARTAAPPPQSIPTQDLQCSLLQACDRHFAQGDPDSLGRCRAELRCITRTPFVMFLCGPPVLQAMPIGRPLAYVSQLTDDASLGRVDVGDTLSTRWG